MLTKPSLFSVSVKKLFLTRWCSSKAECIEYIRRHELMHCCAWNRGIMTQLVQKD